MPMSAELQSKASMRSSREGLRVESRASSAETTPAFQVIRRNGSVTPFDATKITVAVTKAFLAVEGGRAAASRRVHDVVEDITTQVVAALTRRTATGRTFHVEEIQDQV